MEQEKEDTNDKDPDQEENEPSDSTENEDLRRLILQQLASMESSDVSDEESYRMRLSCILEDDESESSASQGRSKEFQKSGSIAQKMRERDKLREELPLTGESEESESSNNMTMLCDGYDLDRSERVQVTDLDELSIKTPDRDKSPSEKTEILLKTDEDNVKENSEEETEDTEEEEEGEVSSEPPFAIKKLKSSDNILRKKIVPKRTEFSSDSSDIDISISNEKPCDVTMIGTAEDRENNRETERTIEEEDLVTELESQMFPKVSRSYLERTKSRDEEIPEDNDSKEGSIERELLQFQDEDLEPKKILQVVHLRSKSPRVYTPPVPPETYLWEELKRIRGKGGYPWTYLDKPPFDEAAWKKYMEHEYEPINPPRLSVLRRREEEVDTTVRNANESVIPESEKQFERLPRDDGFVKRTESQEHQEKTAYVDKEKIKEDEKMEELDAEQMLQSHVETPQPEQSETKTASRMVIDMDVGVPGPSRLEEIPLSRSTRSKMRNQARGIQQKLRNQAGKMRTKLKSISRPSLKEKKDGAALSRLKLRMPERPKFRLPEKTKFSLPERPKFKLPDKSKFSLPERPKFHLPETPKFSLPEIPKFHLPERPKLHLPERPKLHLPERPKLHLPERPKLHLPERPKFHLPERPKFSLPDRAKLHLPERPKLHLPEKAKIHLPEMSKFHLPERPKFHLPDRPKFHLPNRPKINLPNFVKPLRERQETGPRKNMLELDLKNYPKIFTSKSKERGEYVTSSPKKTRGSTPPPKMQTEGPMAPERKKVPVGQRWLKNMDDIKFADEDMSVELKGSRKSDHSDSMSDFRDKDLGGYMEDLDDSRFPPGGIKTLSTKSSLSHMSDRDVESLNSSEGKLRKGVLEEIDSDEFFLRQKGISQEDIDMGKYLSHEIREAFRSPEVNALARMSYEFDEIDVENEMKKPERSLKKKSNLRKYYESDPALSDNIGYKTYPPRRPERKSRSQSKSLVNEEAIIQESGRIYQNEHRAAYQEDDISEYYKSPGPVKEYHHYKVPRPIHDSAPIPYKRKKAAKKKLAEALQTEVHTDQCLEQPLASEVSMDPCTLQPLSPETIVNQGPVETLNSEFVDQCPPQPLTRRKSKKKLNAKQSSLDEGLKMQEAAADDDEISKEHKYVNEVDLVLDEAPTPPRRTRSLTRSMRSSRSLRSVGLDDSREVASLHESHFEQMAIPVETQSLIQFETAKPHHYETTEDDPGCGYATIGKPTVARPDRHKKEKPQRPPPPRRKRDITSTFNTVPRRSPVRPMRNYSTLGPSRPPRRSKTQSKDRVIEGYTEIESESPIMSLKFEESHGSNKDLKKEEVIERMKGRPLPPPPRPPRQKSKGPEDFSEIEDEEAKISIALLKGEPDFEVETLVRTSLQGTEPVEEVCIATQTDPLPDDFLLDIEEAMIQEFSHEQLKIQQNFVEQLKQEEEMEAGTSSQDAHERYSEQPLNDQEPITTRLEMELLAELQREAKSDIEEAMTAEVPEPFDADLGYASLGRRQHKQDIQQLTSKTASEPKEESVSANANILRTDRLDVRELGVERLNVRELQAEAIRVNDLQTNRLHADEVNTRSGNLSLGNIELPPSFIQEIVDKIPWEEIRQAAGQVSGAQQGYPSPYISPPPRRHRKHHRATSSSEEERSFEEGRPHRRHTGRSQQANVTELSKQLAVACAASGVNALRTVASRIQATPTEDKALMIRAILFILVILIAGILLLGSETKTIHHHWDFQFPPQPPPRQL